MVNQLENAEQYGDEGDREFFTLVDLIQTCPELSELKYKLSRYERGSIPFYKALFKNMPLSSGTDFKRYLREQSKPVAGSETEGYGPIYRNYFTHEGRLVDCLDKTVRTGYECFNLSVAMYPENRLLGSRVYDPVCGSWGSEYVWQTVREVQKRSLNFGSGILSIVNIKRGKELRSNDFIVSIMSPNRSEWVITDLACQAYSLANAALYETLGPDTSEYIMNLTEAPVIVLVKSNLFKIFQLVDKLPNLNTIIVMDEEDAGEIAYINSTLLPSVKNKKGEKISVFSMKQVEEVGALNNLAPIPPTPETVYTISFTSGTTSMPKGVVLTHRNYVSAVTFSLCSAGLVIPGQGYSMCFLPLTHIYQRQIFGFTTLLSAGSGFLHKPDPEVLIEDLKILKPHYIALVPRVLTKIESGLKNTFSTEMSSITKSIASTVLEAKKERFLSRGGPDDSIVNSMVYRKLLIDKVRDSLGLSNVGFLTIGSAPVSPDTLMYLRSALDLGIMQGYGLTESFAGAFVSEANERDVGSCGPPSASCEFKLKSIPAMNYDAVKDNKGEVFLRGPQIFREYFKSPKATAEVVDKDGWFATGDVGWIDGKGRLHIIDRVKNIFKLSQGEYLAPEKVENAYLSSTHALTQMFVYGDSLYNFAVGIVGVDIEAFKGIINHVAPEYRTVTGSQLLEVVNGNISLKKMVLQYLNSNVQGLQGFEKIGNVYFDIEPLKVAENTLTPTLKIKRPQTSKRYSSQLKSLYEEGAILKKEKL
ncbi:medium-chain fatty acid-CoA ligase FAA2 Ecym_1185 [Eremothecium cymbalariae DBVPG|uniref:AMP-dependent synthetase/ligase domain-containing protein n=1 Tax=Eremothecium cymbalariae (strain CBS 270.75 / DBVPG 7215 / KCTC 17166 / NRRL Y-17582) TaxID=931890 RepID=G8JMX1_ERECY|nr:hypothetical protein Ecym_1185 [Eremothecium cymbalariae DBVPG\